MAKVRYPEIKIRLEDYKDEFLLSVVIEEMRKINVPEEIINEYKTEAMSGDFYHMIDASYDWVIIY
jgi:hypothetical protein